MKCEECNGRGSFLFAMSNPTCEACGGSGEARDEGWTLVADVDFTDGGATDGEYVVMFDGVTYKTDTAEDASRWFNEMATAAGSATRCFPTHPDGMALVDAKPDPSEDPRRPEFWSRWIPELGHDLFEVHPFDVSICPSTGMIDVRDIRNPGFSHYLITKNSRAPDLLARYYRAFAGVQGDGD